MTRRRGAPRRGPTDLAAAWRVYSHKAPVNIPGAQRQAAQAWRIVEPYLTEAEKCELWMGVGHATGLCYWEGRGEFDGACKRIATRLGLK